MTEQTFMTNARGDQVRIDNIKPQDLLADDLVKAIVERAEELNAQLAEFKAWGMSEVTGLREAVAAEYGATLGGKKGNITLFSFDGTLQVQIQIGESISFGPELDAAKALIDECVREWSSASDEKIKTLIEHAFQVNKQGRIDTARVLGLRRLDISDARWQRAMDAIGDAIRVTGSTPYLRVYRCDPETGEKEPISLNIASV